MIDEQCSNCRFWLDMDGESGYCRRFPPQIIAGTVMTISPTGEEILFSDAAFPVSDVDEWCGEFSPLVPK